MSIKDWPRGERPRERLLLEGAQALSDAELLAILLSTGSPGRGRTALDCARRMLEAHGSLRGLARSSCSELGRIAGIGPAKACRVQAALEVGRRAVLERRRLGVSFRGSRDVFEAYSVRLRDEKQEVFVVMLLDSKSRLLREERTSVGSLDQSLVHPREVFRPAIREAAASVIFVHNHPSGDPCPSREDVRLTERLVDAGRLLGIRVLDHIIIGEGRYFSFFDEGRLGTEGDQPA